MMKILVIDDEKPTLSMFKLFLTAYGYDVYIAEDGEKGLVLFSEISPEIVFTDIKMPGMDGLEVLRRIRRTGIPSEVIIITGHGDMEKAVEALDLDASDFISKPVERIALNSALARAEKRRRQSSRQTFDFSEQTRGNEIVISVKGKLTASAEDSFSTFLKSIRFEEIEKVSMVFDDSFSIDRSGISILTGIIRDMRHKDISVVLENLSYNYIRVFQMAGIDKTATLKETIPEE